MGDKRTDSGQFYPGGKTIPRQPVRPGGGSDADAVHYYEETKTASEKAQACANIGAMPADTPIPSVTGKLTMKPLPKYLHALCFDDTYPADAAWLYGKLGPSDIGRCSAVRRGGKLWRNYDWTFDDAAEFVVKVYSSSSRFGSVGVASVGTRLTENDVMSAVNSRYYKCLPGMTLDGINEKGVVAEINVDGGPKTGWHGHADDGGIHILAAVRWVLDHGETAAQAAEWIADHIIQPTGEMNFHFMIADATATYIVENGVAHDVTDGVKVLTNYALYDSTHAGGGKERYQLLAGGADISAVLWTKAYQPGNDWHSDFESEAQHISAIEQWAAQGATKEAHRGKTTSSGAPWWQTVHTTEYDFAAKTMKVAVQENDDWYTFAVGSANITLDDTVTQSSENGVKSRGIWSAIWGALTALPTGFSSLYDWCAAKFAGKVDTQFTETIPAGAYTFTNGKNGFQAWAWKDESDEWHCVAVNVPQNVVGPVFNPSPYVFVEFHDPNMSEGDNSIFILSVEGGWDYDTVFVNEYMIDGDPPINAVTDAPLKVPLTSFTDNLTTTAAKAKIAEAMPAPIDPASATTSGKAADALAVKNALAGKVPIDSNGHAIVQGSSDAKVQIGNAGTGHDDSTSPFEVVLDAYGVFLIRSFNYPDRVIKFRLPFNSGDSGDFYFAMLDNIPDISGKLDTTKLAPAYSATTSYSVGNIVSREGVIYQCDQAGTGHTPTGGASDAYWHVAKLSDFFSNSNGLLTGTIDERTPYALRQGTDAMTDRSVKVYDRSEFSAQVDVTFPTNIPVGITDFEAWIKIGSEVPTITYPDVDYTIEWKDGKVPATTDYKVSATNIVHFTIAKESATATPIVTAILAGFKAATTAA